MCIAFLKTIFTTLRMLLVLAATVLGTERLSHSWDYRFRSMQTGACGFFVTGLHSMRQWPKESIHTLGVGCMETPTTPAT